MSWRPHGAMLLFTALVGTSFTVGAMITHALAPEALTALRFLVAVAVMAGVVALTPGWRTVRLADGLRYLWIGLLLIVFFVTMFEALRLTDPLSLSAEFTLVPLLSALIGWPLNGQSLRGSTLGWLLIGTGGALWVLFDGSLAKLMALHPGRGEALFLLGVAAYAAYSPFVKRLHRGESLAQINLMALLAGLVLLGLYAPRTIVSADWAHVSPGVYAGIAYLAVMTTAVTFFLIKYASLRLTSAKTMAYTFLLPAFVAAYEGMLGHGWPSMVVIAGMAVTGLAVAMIETAPGNRPA